MTDLTEYGDVMINAYMDEWGRRKIDGILEDGIKIISPEAAVTPPTIPTPEHARMYQPVKRPKRRLNRSLLGLLKQYLELKKSI